MDIIDEISDLEVVPGIGFATWFGQPSNVICESLTDIREAQEKFFALTGILVTIFELSTQGKYKDSCTSSG